MATLYWHIMSRTSANMDPATLLSMPPELLAKAVLHRREQLLQSLPSRLEELREELKSIVPVASESVNKRNELDEKVALLKNERNENKVKAFELINRSKELREQLLEEGRLKNPDPKWAKDKLMEEISSMEEVFQTTAGDHKAEQKFLRKVKGMMAEHQAGVDARIKANPELQELNEIQSRIKPLFDAAEKAHDAMLELVAERAPYHDSWRKQSSLEQSLISQIRTIEEVLATSSKAEGYWKNCLENGFTGLGSAAEEIRKGGLSSIAKRRKNRQESEKSRIEQSKGEEE